MKKHTINNTYFLWTFLLCEGMGISRINYKSIQDEMWQLIKKRFDR